MKIKFNSILSTEINPRMIEDVKVEIIQSDESIKEKEISTSFSLIDDSSDIFRFNIICNITGNSFLLKKLLEVELKHFVMTSIREKEEGLVKVIILEDTIKKEIQKVLDYQSFDENSIEVSYINLGKTMKVSYSSE